MSTNILFFDTETTGLPNFKARSADPNQPKVLQLGCILATSKGEELESYQTLIKIGSTSIHPMALAAHGISAEKANKEGIEPKDAFEAFFSLTEDADSLCCHNFNFDIRLMRIFAAQVGESAEVDMADILEMPYYCTMKSTIEFCHLPFPSGRKGNKFPKLEELYQILFNKPFEGAHDALVDVRGTMECFFELQKRGIM
jgi:DNA polymerase III epsilon subunit-like protein